MSTNDGETTLGEVLQYSGYMQTQGLRVAEAVAGKTVLANTSRSTRSGQA